MTDASRREFLRGLVPGGRPRCDGSVLVVGAGARARRVLRHLAREGYARIGVVDPDRAEQAAAEVRRRFPAVLVETYPAWLDATNAVAIVEGHSMVVDCTGSPEARGALQAACHGQGVELAHADAYPS